MQYMKNRKTLRGNMTMGAISWLSGPPRDRGTAAGSSTDLIPGSDHQQVRRCAPHGSVPTQLGLQRIGFSFNQGARFVRSTPTMGKQRSRARIHGYCNILLRRENQGALINASTWAQYTTPVSFGTTSQTTARTRPGKFRWRNGLADWAGPSPCRSQPRTTGF